MVTQVPKIRTNATGRHIFTLGQTRNRTRKNTGSFFPSIFKIKTSPTVLQYGREGWLFSYKLKSQPFSSVKLLQIFTEKAPVEKKEMTLSIMHQYKLYFL